MPTEENAPDARQVDGRRRDAWLAAIILGLVIVGTHYDVIVQGRSLITTNFANPLDFRSLPQNYGPNMVPPDEWTRRHLSPFANIRDPGATWWQWEPSTQFLKQAIRTGEWPFWDPNVAGGTPAMANLIPAFFFPPYLLVVLLGASVALLNAYFLLIAWTTAFATFLFIRRHDIAFGPSLLGALTLMLSGTTQQHLGTFIGQAAACLPLALYATRIFVDQPGRRRAIGLAIAYGAISLASFPPVLAAVFGTAAVYALVAIVNEQPAGTRARAAAWWACAAALACGLVAWYYVPALAARAASPQVSAAYGHAGLETISPGTLYQLLSPTMMGGVQTYLPPLPHALSDGPYLPYIGIVAIALAFVSRRGAGRGRTLWIACTATGLVIVLKLLGAPGFQWIGHVPVVREIHIAHYFGLVLPFLVACLAALGLQAVLAGSTAPIRAVLIGIAVLVTIESLWQIADARETFASARGAFWVRDWRVLATVSAMTVATLVVAALKRTDVGVRRAAAAILVCLCAGEGIYNGWFPNPSAWSIFEHPVPYVKVLQQARLTRSFSFAAPYPNLGSAFDVASLDSLMAFNPPRAFRLYAKYGDGQQEVFMREAKRIPPEPVLDRASVGLVATRTAFAPIMHEAHARGYEPLFNDGFVAIFKRPTLPRFLFSSEYRVVPAAVALEAIADPNSREIVLEEPPGIEAVANTAGDPAVLVEALHRNSATLAVDAPRAGLVYASESFFDGWTATVNGTPAPILPANYAFRAVVVQPGRSRVEFRYRPPGLTVGLWVSAVSALLLIGLATHRRNRTDGTGSRVTQCRT